MENYYKFNLHNGVCHNTIGAKSRMNVSYKPVVEALQRRRYSEAEALAKQLIRLTPLEGQGWVLLGEALLHQGFGLAARDVFERAWILDPEANWVKPVGELLLRAEDGALRNDINALLQVKPVKVAAGIIAGNEERCIERCLSSLEGAVDEIVLVDSSTDRTAELAAQFPLVKIVKASWSGDFAAQRNIGLSHIQSDWVIWIDADEQLHPEDKGILRLLAGMFQKTELPTVLQIWQMNEVAGNIEHDHSRSRMFPVTRGLAYHGLVHEQVIVAGEAMYAPNKFQRRVRIRLLHDGYEPHVVEIKQKRQRNLHLLKKMIEQEPDNPGWLLYYARESIELGLTEGALARLHEAESLLEKVPTFDRILELYKWLIHAHMQKSDWDQAEAYCHKALSLHPNFPDVKFMLAQLKLHQMDVAYAEADRLLKQAKMDFSTYRGNVTADHSIAAWKADTLLADLARRAGKLADAKAMYLSFQEGHPQKDAIAVQLSFLEEQRKGLQG
jgi:tetratricopeptide (TPR) repeat protein